MNFKESPSNPVRITEFVTFSYRVQGSNLAFAEGQGEGVNGRPQEDATTDAQGEAPALASRAIGLCWGSPQITDIEEGR